MDPDAFSNVSLDEFSKYLCCLYEKDKDKFEALKPQLNAWLQQFLADPLRSGDDLIKPSGSLCIEPLPATHLLLEGIMLHHRGLDVFKVREEVRRSGLENLRNAAGLLHDERDDPDLEKTILVEGNGLNPNIDVSDNT